MDKYGCLFIDATWKDMLAAFVYAGQTGNRSQAIRDVEELFGGQDHCLACFSVRSALDLFLSVMKFPHGSEILMTAINIPYMVAIIEHHNLTVVPVDIDLDTLCPRYEDMAALVTARTVAVLSAHIYGRWTNMEPVARIAQEHNLLVLEDCAECFSGLSNLGHPQSDVVFFSFGAIKYATAMGGAVVRVKDRGILTRMRTELETYPVFSEDSYVERLFRYSIVMFFVNNPLMTWTSVHFLKFLGIDYKEMTVSLLRGFPGDIISKLRYQPATSLLRIMVRQLQQFDVKEHARSKINGDFVLKTLANDVLIPGSKADGLGYWLFPILVDNPKEWVKELEKERIEAYCGVTQLDLVKPKNDLTKKSWSKEDPHSHSDPSSSFHEETAVKSGTCSKSCKVSDDFGFINHEYAELYPHTAKFLIDHVLYLPVHKRIPLNDLQLLCQGVINVAKRRHPGLVNSKQFLLNEVKLHSKL